MFSVKQELRIIFCSRPLYKNFQILSDTFKALLKAKVKTALQGHKRRGLERSGEV